MTVRSTAERVGYKRLTRADIVSKCIYLAVRRWLGCRRCPNADESVEADSQGTGVETRERSTVWGKCGDGPPRRPRATCDLLGSLLLRSRGVVDIGTIHTRLHLALSPVTCNFGEKEDAGRGTKRNLSERFKFCSQSIGVEGYRRGRG